MSTFSGLEIASRALAVNQEALNVVAHNLANSKTPGYSRQVVTMEATKPYSSTGVYRPGGTLQIGTGVEISAITRVQDQFIDDRLLTATGASGQSAEMAQTLTRIQSLYNEPGTGGISTLMNNFFNSFVSLQQDAESMSVRSTVVQNAQSVATAFNSLANGMDDVRDDLQTRISSTVGSVNAAATKIADLNGKIRLAVASGEQPNDLMDQRDQLVRDLSTAAGVRQVAQVDMNGKETGVMDVYVGDFALVQGTSTNDLPTQSLTQGTEAYLTDGTSLIHVTAGTLGGLIQSNRMLQTYKDDLDTVASNLISQFNAQHALGFGLDGVDGRAFFTGSDAHSIAVASGIVSNPGIIAAADTAVSGVVAKGDGDNAAKLSKLGTTAMIGSYSLVDSYAAAVSRAGADAKAAAAKQKSDGSVVTQVTNLRNSNSGVSTDEELTNMLTYQRAYQSAAKMVTVLDGLIEDVINMVK